MASLSPLKDYMTVTRDFATAVQSHIRQIEDHPLLFERNLLDEAYKVQATMIKQHFAVLSALYEQEFTNNATDPNIAIQPDTAVSESL